MTLLIDIPDQQAAPLFSFRASLVARCNSVRDQGVPCNAIALTLLLPLTNESLFDTIRYLREAWLGVYHENFTGLSTDHQAIELALPASLSVDHLFINVGRPLKRLHTCLLVARKSQVISQTQQLSILSTYLDKIALDKSRRGSFGLENL